MMEKRVKSASVIPGDNNADVYPGWYGYGQFPSDFNVQSGKIMKKAN